MQPMGGVQAGAADARAVNEDAVPFSDKCDKKKNFVV